VLYGNGHGLSNLYWGRQDNIDRWFARDSARGAWQEFLTVDPMEFESPFRPAGYGADVDRVFNITWDPDAQAWSLYRQELMVGEYQSVNERVFAREALDVELVDTMGPHLRVVSAAFLEGTPRRAIVDPRIAEVYQTTLERMPEHDIEIVDESWDRNRYLVRAREPFRAGEFLLVDMENETIDSIVPEYARLADFELAETQFIQFESSTEGTIAGNLTVPVGVDGPVPAVIMPRPRASHEDVADPHYLVQFLASSGYAVFRVNNRVEEEYGRGWLPERAVAGWNQSADDINDAADFLIENGVSEPGMICGAGKDYGAYVALMSAIKYPELFNCIVSIAGVTDPRDMPGGIVLTARGDRDLLAEASPVRRVAELDAPTLLFHGWSDADFDVSEHSLRFTTEAEIADKDVTFIEYPYANHEIRQRSYRIDMLARIRGFLSEHIGPELTEEESASEVAQWRPAQGVEIE
jgi:dipeptidyl aminopeptidase/acylaminoacyl peptidase